MRRKPSICFPLGHPPVPGSLHEHCPHLLRLPFSRKEQRLQAHLKKQIEDASKSMRVGSSLHFICMFSFGASV